MILKAAGQYTWEVRQR